MRTKEEQAAIDKYLSEGGEVYKARTGESGLYDEFGVPLEKARGRMFGVGVRGSEKTAQRMQQVRKMAAEGVPRKEIAKRLGMSYNSLYQLVRRWGGWGYTE